MIFKTQLLVELWASIVRYMLLKHFMVDGFPGEKFAPRIEHSTDIDAVETEFHYIN